MPPPEAATAPEREDRPGRVLSRQQTVACFCRGPGVSWEHEQKRRRGPMESKDVLKRLREKRGLTQDQLAERVMVTRQAVSRWETGETRPNTDTLRLLSREYDVSINTLLGSPRQLVCQCCGMPLNDDGMISREPDGSFNEDYCKWCYADGGFAYESKEALLDFLVGHMPNPDNAPEEERRARFDGYLSRLSHWR